MSVNTCDRLRFLCCTYANLGGCPANIPATCHCCVIEVVPDTQIAPPSAIKVVGYTRRSSQSIAFIGREKFQGDTRCLSASRRVKCPSQAKDCSDIRFGCVPAIKSTVAIRKVFIVPSLQVPFDKMTVPLPDHAFQQAICRWKG